MAYVKQTFEDGQVLTASKLNHMEDGIAEAHDNAVPAYDNSGFTKVLTHTSDGLSWEAPSYVPSFGTGDYGKALSPSADGLVWVTIPDGSGGSSSGGSGGEIGFVTTESLSSAALTGMNGRETGFYLFQASKNITINGWDTGAKEMLCYVQHSTAHESSGGIITKYVYRNTYSDLRSGIVYTYNGSGAPSNVYWSYTKKEPAFTSDLTAENILPAITESDAGKVLVVSSSGKWAVGTVSGGGSSVITDGVGIKSVRQTTTSTEDGGTNVITVTLTDGTTSTFNVKNGSKGSTPVRGTDYWTEDDIATIKSYVDDAILGGAW